MNKKIGLCLAIITLVLCMLIPIKSVYAAEKKITNLEVTQSNNKISVKGKTESGVLAVAIAVYNEKGTELIKMQTTSVNSSNEFSDTVEQKEGNYLIKVADYEGGPYAEQSVKVKEDDTKKEEEKTESEDEQTQDSTEPEKENTVEETTTKDTEKSNNPKTGDNIIITIAIFAVAALGVFATSIINKKNKAKKK